MSHRMRNKNTANSDGGYKKKIKEKRTRDSKKANATRYGRTQDEVKNNILKNIRIYTAWDGISINDLADTVNLDRKSTQPYTKELVAEGLIKKNKHGLYVSTDQILIKFIDESKSKSYAFERYFLTFFDSLSILYNFDGMYHTKRTKNIFKYRYDIEEGIFQLDFGKGDDLEKSIFDFSNRIGAFITFLLVYWFNSSLYDNKLSQEECRQIIFKNIQNTINKMMESTAFTSIYYNFVKNVDENYNNKRIKDKITIVNSRIPFDLEFHNHLTSALWNIYPKFMLEFEKISDFLYDNQNQPVRIKMSPISRTAKADKTYLERIRKQQDCKHQFNKLAEGKFTKKMVKCIKCGKITTSSKANDIMVNQKKNQT